MSHISHYKCHHAVPGRIRIAVAGVKANLEAAKSLELLLGGCPGVEHVKASSITGNVLVRYSTRSASASDVIRHIIEMGFTPVVESQVKHHLPSRNAAIAEIGKKIAKELARAALKQALAGSAPAILLELI